MNKEELDVKVEIREAVSLASQQNGYPILKKIRVKNGTGGIIRNVRVSISFDPCFANCGELHLGDIPDGKSAVEENIPVTISTGYLANLTESVSGSVTVEVRYDGEENARKVSKALKLYPYDRWEGEGYPELLASFCVPNNPTLTPVIGRAAEILGKRTGDPSFNGYQTGDPGRVKQMAGALFDAVREQGITYSTPPANCGEPGQRIRMPEEILPSGFGTCLDTAMLFASCLEAVGLRPIVILTTNHAFCGVWLTEDCSRNIVNRDASSLRKRSADGINELVTFETTMADKCHKESFDQAVSSAESTLSSADNFLFWTDIEAARRMDFKPLPQRVLTADGYVILSPVKGKEHKPEALPDMDTIDLNRENQVDRRTIWERKLLDLSVRNALLNLRRSLQCLEPDPVELCDCLEEGTDIALCNNPVKNLNSGRGIIKVLSSDNPGFNYSRKELRDGRIHIYEEDPGHTEFLVSGLRSSARVILEECGANSLYVTIGTLKWTDPESHPGKSFHAPVILVPVEFTRLGNSVHGTGEEPVVNLTLLEMLRQKFGITIPGLDPLPRKDGHIDVRRVLNTIRLAVMEREDWDVDPLVFIGTFNFNKFVMWNDIHTHSEMLYANPVTRSLMTGYLEPDLNGNGVPGGEKTVDSLCPPSDILLPVKADSSQMMAIRDAVDGKSIIVHGPAGTGKSQTITNIIANALYRGRKVLFVSEKKAALEVVRRRLESIGLDPFCLELHSNTATKTRVLKKLDDTLNMPGVSAPQGFAECASRLEEQMALFNRHVTDLHSKSRCGLSLYDCLSASMSMDDNVPVYELPREWIESATPETIAEARNAVEEFTTSARHSAISPEHPLMGLPVTAYTPRIEQQIHQALEGILNARTIFGVHRWASVLEKLLGFMVGKRLSKGFSSNTRNKASRWLSGMGDLRRYALYCKGRQRVYNLGLECVAVSFEKGVTGVDEIQMSFEKSLNRSLAECMMSDTPELNTFCGDMFESSIKDFRKTSEQMRQMSRRQIVSKLVSSLPAVGTAVEKTSQLYILRRAVRNIARGMSLRTFFSKIPDLLPQICPCMLMSPISVAQYLKAEAGMFDIVIFDEASQMPTSEAVGAIARGKSLVVVGDPHQLPPTTFFEAHTFDEDNADREDLESILDDVLALPLPSRHLRWHYRSRHESLITFSNLNYYDGRLLTFPSNDDLAPKVTLHRVKGLYDRGRTRQNEAEAAAIVGRVRELLSNPETKDFSIGIVTFNINQRSLIERKLEALYKKDREIFLLAGREDEPLFVKSLENVQGDERDIILISVGYGRDRDGRMSMNFGPLNQAGGWRRLNVAVSRSKFGMEIYSTIGPEDVTSDSGTPRGVRDLKSFLAYAKEGILPPAAMKTGEPERDLFVESVSRELELRGLSVRTNIGTSDFRVDVGVIDPEHPEKYLYGILCDGRCYASAESASDREIIRPEVLEGLGWKIERRWIMDSLLNYSQK